MAKLSQLLTLECMLDAYDSLNIKDSWIIERQGVCIVELLDIINPKLKRLINSKTRLSCRNVLMAVGIHETMTSEERTLFEHMRKETQQYFASKFNLKERKRSKEKKNLPPRPLYKEKETKEKRSKTHPPSATRVRLFIRSVGATSKYMIVIHLKTSTISGAKRIRRLARCDFRGSAIGTPKRG